MSRLKKRQPLAFRAPDNGLSQGMLGTFLGRGRKLEQLFSGEAGGGNDLRHFGLARRDGAGFIENDGIDLMGDLQRFAVFNQNSVFRAFPGSHHDGCGSGKPQGAGAGDHQHGNENGQSKGQTLPCQKPACKGQERDQADGRDKITGDHVGQLRDGSLGPLGILHQLDDLRQGCVAAHVGGAKADRPVGIDGGRINVIADFFIYGHALSGEHGLVDGSVPFQDDAVNGDLLARPH